MMQTVHEMTIARLAEHHPHAATRGFAVFLRKLATKAGSFLPSVDVIPDLWWHEAGDGRECDLGTVTCIEVENSTPISADKLRAYCGLWFDLDLLGYELRLLVADRWGKLSPADLREYFYVAHAAKAA